MQCVTLIYVIKLKEGPLHQPIVRLLLASLCTYHLFFVVSFIIFSTEYQLKISVTILKDQ